MVEKSHAELDDMLRHLMLVGFGALLGWTGATAYGVVGASWHIQTNDALRFLLAILIVTFARRTYAEVMQWRLSKMPADERLGFATPIWETVRASEMSAERDAPVTEAPQPPQ